MNLSEAMWRIDELQRRVEVLEARHTTEIHNHYHQPSPDTRQPQVPQQPLEWNPPAYVPPRDTPITITCSGE